ncbi:capsule polysaccharide biosynthesis protein [Longilinea arvoryzae]|uniref:Capsule polysaccharide biosynthesis protein n=1 Tax=Longilinea arvoryzae TaxID=360412 RepID=A0A0S7B8C5_9CHLR|nr:hypothetical protein [Longilinea arvoryzae]GAP13772.1 capsule polysaccharide biosynthesis protein [Longilinea arvoryzae]
MTAVAKDTIKKFLGEIPFTAELYWLVRQRGRPIQSRFSLKHLQDELPGMVAQAQELAKTAPTGRKVFIFATLHYWIEHAALLAVSLAAQGHDVTLAYLPYAEWQKEINRFDLRRQNAYARKVLSLAEPLIKVVSFVSARAPYMPLPEDVMNAVKQVTNYDTQYTLQTEEIDTNGDVYKLRLDRNREAAQAALAFLRHNRPDVAIIPNGTIQELGVVYHVARSLKIKTVTYEFGDQRQRIWIAQNAEVMRQETDSLWKASREKPLTDAQLEKMKSLVMARQRATMWENFARLWQDVPAQGGEQARATLGLDQRPVVLLATNVLGDSLTLGRQVFSRSMAEWISRTVQYFAGRPEVQLVIRVHPGEVLTHGPSMVDVVHQVLPRLPEHIRLIGPKEKVNTYDIIDVADMGLVYTTTVGLEMAMSGLPVVVAGQTHYRGRGFTQDPDSWVAYFKMLGQILENPKTYRLSKDQMHLAWRYAYRFFFEYPLPFPWHLVRMWDDYRARPLGTVLNGNAEHPYANTFDYLVGKPLDWSKISK